MVRGDIPYEKNNNLKTPDLHETSQIYTFPGSKGDNYPRYPLDLSLLGLEFNRDVSGDVRCLFYIAGRPRGGDRISERGRGLGNC